MSELSVFAGYGIELEYMIVQADTLEVLPISDGLLAELSASAAGDGGLAWSNELVLHLVELKNIAPGPLSDELATRFQNEIIRVNRLLEAKSARLMPTASHPWMNPVIETRLWPHQDAAIYQAFDRIFDCHRHGWANLQSMQINLPFADDSEFARLHAAIRLVLPILPAIAASSPIVEGNAAGSLDFRMQSYLGASSRVPSLAGEVIPEVVASRADYRSKILEPIYRDIAPFDSAGLLRHEWLNSRGAIARFDRNAIEIRVVDLQECPRADLAIAAATVSVVEDRYRSMASNQSRQIGSDSLVRILGATIRYGDQALIEDRNYLEAMGYSRPVAQAGELWRHLLDRSSPGCWREPLELILERGPLARRILQATNGDFSRKTLYRVYRELCDCLATGRLFVGAD